jgi:hypothetical protein
MEQTPINSEVGRKLSLQIEDIDAVKNPHLITQYGLKVTPTIVILINDVVRERFEGVVHAEQLEEALKKYR